MVAITEKKLRDMFSKRNKGEKTKQLKNKPK